MKDYFSCNLIINFLLLCAFSFSGYGDEKDDKHIQENCNWLGVQSIRASCNSNTTSIDTDLCVGEMICYEDWLLDKGQVVLKANDEGGFDKVRATTKMTKGVYPIRCSHPKKGDCRYQKEIAECIREAAKPNNDTKKNGDIQFSISPHQIGDKAEDREKNRFDERHK